MAAQNAIADKDLGYAQFAAGGIDASTLVSSATFGSAAAAGIPPGTELIIMTPAAQAIRWRCDGVAPTAAIGYPLAVGAEVRLSIAQLPQLRVIAQVAGAVLNVYAFGRSGSPS
jgi:hypothetical protein